jgi:hypothetical protein
MLARGKSAWRNCAYMVMIGGDGEVTCEKYCNNRRFFYRVCEIADVGFVFTVHPAFIRTDMNDEITDQNDYHNGPRRFRDFVSCRGDGFASFRLPNAPRDSMISVTRVDSDFNLR